ncbi:MAG: DUF4388 domain-containing protein [Deltaproteobacteria bacterium]|nr:DUF4388 domain-containing protein [Deltaproteobacteria bacterium]
MSPSKVAKGLNADLENFELTDVMQLITQQVKCGILSVEGSNGNCSWSFNEGSLVDFNCHFPGHSFDLKTILIKGEHLDEQRFLSLLKEPTLNPAHHLEKALIKNGIINREELEKINLRRLIESFIITLQWVKGQYKFIPTSEVKNHAFLPPQDTNFVILEAMRQIDEMAVMKKRLQPLEKVYETTLSLNSDEASTKDISLFREGLEKQFDQDEYMIYKLFDGIRRLDEVLNISIIGQFNTCRITLDFLDRGIITPQTSESAEYRHSKSTKPTHNLTGIALLLLSGALLISVATSIRHFGNPEKEKNPTLFTAIIDNLLADQEMVREQARELLPK